LWMKVPIRRKRGASSLRGVRSIVVAEDEAIANFLGDAENPAHTDWVNGGNFKGKYENGSQLLEFVRHVPLEIIKAIKGGTERSGELSLAEFFAIKASELASGPTAKTSRTSFLPGFEPESPDGLPEPSPRPVVIDRLSGGFCVRKNPACDEAFDGVLIVRCAYHVGHGRQRRPGANIRIRDIRAMGTAWPRRQGFPSWPRTSSGPAGRRTFLTFSSASRPPAPQRPASGTIH